MEYHHKVQLKKKINTQAWAGQVMATVFWDTDGVIQTDFLEHATTINSQPL
jgi:hypothetical protein